MHALDEVQPAFGVSEEELQQVVQNGIIHFSKRVSVSKHITALPASLLMSNLGNLEGWQSASGASPKLRQNSTRLCSASRWVRPAPQQR